MKRPDPVSDEVYTWLKAHADADGLVETSAPSVAVALNHPKRTVQGSFQRLEQRGKVYPIGMCKFVVVDLASVEDL